MSLILNLRGTNGSGKSYAARSLIHGAGINQHLAGVKCLTDPATSICLVGDYPPGKTGGCDRVKTYELMRAAIAEAAHHYEVVVFESVTVSTVFGSWAEFYRKCLQFYWVYLDTPVDLCIQRISERNGGQPFNQAMVVDKHKAIARTREKALMAGFSIFDLDHKRAVDQLNELVDVLG